MWDNLAFYVRHSLNDLQINRRRTLFALLCIAAGVAAIVSLQTLGEMINATLTGSLQESNKGDIHIFSGPEFGASEDLVERGRDEGVLEPGGLFFPDYFGARGLSILEDWFANQSPAPATITFLQTFSDLTTGSAVNNPANNAEQTFVSVFMVDAQRYPLYGKRASVDGVPLRDLLRAPSDIAISENLADKLDVRVGDVVRVSGASTDFTVRGIIPDDAEAGLENISASMFGYYYLDLSAAQYFDQAPATYDVFVRLDDPTQIEAVNTAFQDDFPYLTTTTTEDLAERNSQVADVLNDLVTIMGLVSLLIGGIGIVNTMLVIVSRRTLEVAVLKTVGLEPQAVSALFLVEAVLMGIIGSVLGVVLGWGLALALKGVAEGFLAQNLTFRITPSPAITGVIVGVIITAIFGMLPTLAAGRIRPGLVLRPSETLVPRAGRMLTFLAVLIMLVVITLIVRGLVGDLLSSATMRSVAGGLGAVLGGLAGLAILLGTGKPRRSLNRVVRWGLLLLVLPASGYVFGSSIPALLLVTGAAIQVALLYGILWLLIWALGGGSISVNAFLMSLPPLMRLAALPFLALLPVLIWPIFILWGIGRLIQRFGFVDLKIAMRSMLAAKGRSATTLLALVVGVFTLSLITMLVDSITNQFEALLEREAGGNVFIFSPGRGQTLQQIEEVLAEQPGVNSYAAVGSYEVKLLSVEDGQTREVRTAAQLKDTLRSQNDTLAQLFDFTFGAIDARELGSNLPDVRFYRGRQLTPADAGQPVIVISADQVSLAIGLDVGDKMTFSLSDRSDDALITFEIVGMVDRRTGGIQTGSSNYAPIDAFPADLPPSQVTAVVDVDESEVNALRDALESVPGAFVLETRFLNDVINRVIDQFTTFPILVAALALFTGGIVIANSVALSTMERRREIGIMKAIGLQRERVLGMLLLENALLGFVGGLIGVGTGVLILLGLLVGIFQGRLSDAIPIGTAFLLMGICIGIALIAAIVSVWDASGEKPLNVLRYE